MTTSPNPAKDNLTVTVTDESPEVKALSTNENVIIELYEVNTHRLVKQWKFKNLQNQFNLNTSDLRKGHYILTVHKGKYKESTHIIIEE